MKPILIISHDVVGEQMAGPGIRYWELARVLAAEFRVTLAVPDSPSLPEAPCEVWPYQRACWASLRAAVSQADVVVASGDSLVEFPALEALPTPLVIDGYDPHTVETLALWSKKPVMDQQARHAERLDVLRRQCQRGDFFLCASERQRDWWLGALDYHGRVNPLTYRADPTLRALIDVVPYGLPEQRPAAGRPVVRGVWPGIDAHDKIVLWGGGLWEWLDPLTAVRALQRLEEHHKGARVRLVFPGTRHPNPEMPDMPLREAAVALADELGLTGKAVFFGDWVGRQDWPTVLLESDVGLSLHPDTIEARLAYRSRVMDYVWAGLPMVVTRGDSVADLVERRGLGIVVEHGDDGAVAEGILRLLERPGPEAPFDAAREELTWKRCAEPLISFCRDPHPAADRRERVDGPVRSPSGMAGGAAEPSISVIILNWNGSGYLTNCLAAVHGQDYPAFDVTVVDNGSTDGSPELVAERFPSTRLLRNGRNLGFAAGNNAGLRAAGGDLIVLLNSDTEVQAGWLEALARAFDDPSVGIAGSKLLYPDGTIQHAGGFLYGPRGEADHLGRHAPDGRFDLAADVEYVTGAALAIRRSVMDEIGLLDEGFGRAYYEDVDWCYRVRRAGYRTRYEPAARVLHHESVALEAASYELMQALSQGRIRFLLKHRSLDELLGSFRPAEAAWLASLGRDVHLAAARQAYLAALLALPEICAYRGCGPAEAEQLIGLLGDLRTASLRAPGEPNSTSGEAPARAARQAMVEHLQEMAKHQVLVEQPFRSRVPVLGPVIAAVRSLWNAISTKWYVRPLLQQQSAFNAAVTGYLRGELPSPGQPLAAGPGWTDETTEILRECTAIAEQLARQGMQLPQPSAAIQGTEGDACSKPGDPRADETAGAG